MYIDYEPLFGEAKVRREKSVGTALYVRREESEMEFLKIKLISLRGQNEGKTGIITGCQKKRNFYELNFFASQSLRGKRKFIVLNQIK